MAANFWTSSHCNHWLVDRVTLDKARAIDSKYASKRQLACLGIWFANILQKLGKKLQLRQRAIATSIVFFRRFYLKNAYCETDPYMVLAACIFVAAKIEETPVHIKSVIVEARAVFNDLRINIKNFPSDNSKLAEMEFYLLEDLDFHLVVFHPYRSLGAICGVEPADSGLFDLDGPPSLETPIDDIMYGRGTGRSDFVFNKEVVENAWFIINDTYRTDLCLLYPPHLIAIACLFLSLAHHRSQSQTPAQSTRSNSPTKGHASLPGAPTMSTSSSMQSTPSKTMAQTTSNATSDAVSFLAKMNVNLSLIATITQEIMSIWTLWDSMENTKGHSEARGLGMISGGPGVTEGAEIVQLVEKMRQDRDIDRAHPNNGRPVQRGGGATVGAGSRAKG